MDKKESELKIRCTKKEKKRIAEKAESAGKSLSEFAREMLLKGKVVSVPQFTELQQATTEILREMQLVAQYNTRCKNKFLRFEIGIAPRDIEKLKTGDLHRISTTFAKKMQLDNHQWFAVSHKDTRKLHIHLIANRIGIDGKVFQTDFVSNRSARAAEEISREMSLTIANEVVAKEKYRHPKAGKNREEKKDMVRKIAYRALGEKTEMGKTGFLSFIGELQKHDIAVETMRNKQNKAYGFRFLYGGETFKASEIGREFGYRSLFKQFGLEDLVPQTGKTVVPMYEPHKEQQNTGLSAMETAVSVADGVISAVGGLLDVQTHGTDAAEAAFQKKMRWEDKKRRKGRRM